MNASLRHSHDLDGTFNLKSAALLPDGQSQDAVRHFARNDRLEVVLPYPAGNRNRSHPPRTLAFKQWN
jgi:hypothetical protein